MSKDRKLAVICAVALAVVGLAYGLLAWTGSDAAAGPPNESDHVAAAAPALTVGHTEPLEESDGGSDSRADAVEAPVSAPEASPVPEDLVDGRVVDGQANPVVGVAVRVERRDWRANTWQSVVDQPLTTDEGGEFRLARSVGRGRVRVADPDYTNVLTPEWPPQVGASSPIVVVGPRSSYVGLVLGPEGTPLEGVMVALRYDRGLLKELYHGEERPLEEDRAAMTEKDGRFEIGPIGWLPGTKLIVAHASFEWAQVELEPGDWTNLRVTLERPQVDGHVLHGVVVRAGGEALEQVQVAYAGGKSVTAEPGGSFGLDLGDDPQPGTLMAVQPGFLPAHLELDDPREACARSVHEPVELLLDREAMTIEGVAVDQDGVPIPRVQVWTEDGARFAGPRTIEEVADGDSRGESDEHGRFVLGGLREDTYHLRAVHPGTLEVVELPDVDAGARDVRVTFGARAGTRVAGRVLYRDGAPARGVRVYPLLSRRGRDSRGRPPFLVESGRSTDDGGRFEFEELHFDGIRLWITGDQIGEPAKRLEVDLAASADLEDIEVRVAHVVQFEVALVDPTEADAFSAADAEGQLLSLLFTLLGSGRSTSTVGARMKLTGGRSEVVHCSEDVRTLILLRDGQEVRRVPVRVEPGDVRVLEF